VVRRIVSQVLEARPPVPLCLNVNIPMGRPEEIKGIKVCRQCRGYWREDFFCRQNPFGRDYFWLTGSFKNAEPDATDTDDWALAHCYVSVVPIQVDLTNHEQVTSIGGILR
jgi:5'-nucleotidase